MEISDSELIELLPNAEVSVRSSALECLAASFCNEPAMLRGIFDAWDQYGADVAFPEFPIVTHLPAVQELTDEALLRASAMSRERKIVDPVCRCAGKIIEAYSVALPDVWSEYLPRFETIKQSSKIFFRVDVAAMRQRSEMRAFTTSQLEEIVLHVSSETASDSASNVDGIHRARAALDELHSRQGAEAIWHKCIAELETNSERLSAVAEVALEVMSRRPTQGYEESLVRLLGHNDAKVADAVAICLARSRTPEVLNVISREFSELPIVGQLRSAVVLQRLRLPGVASRIRLLKDSVKHDRAVTEALLIAEILQFDFSAVEDWLEALLIIDDRSLERIQQRLHLAIPLATKLDVVDQPRFMKLFRSRLVQ